MSDYTDCILTLAGLLDQDAARELLELATSVDLFPVSSGDGDLDSPNEPLRFYAEDVDLAALDPKLAEFLRNHAIAYVWSWNAGATYGGGAEIHDPLVDRTYKVRHDDGCLMIPLGQVDDVSVIADARAAEAAWDRIAATPLRVAASRHAYLALLEDERLRPYRLGRNHERTDGET